MGADNAGEYGYDAENNSSSKRIESNETKKEMCPGMWSLDRCIEGKSKVRYETGMPGKSKSWSAPVTDRRCPLQIDAREDEDLIIQKEVPVACALEIPPARRTA